MNNNNPNIIFHSVISCIQKVVLYETRNKLYLIGSNNRETRFRILIIDRTAPQDELRIFEDPNEFGVKDIRRFVASLGQIKIISAYGILGFVKFLEGYYLMLVTKRTRCACVGQHLIYTIKDTVMIRINTENTNNSKSSGGSSSSKTNLHPLEQRYLKMFQNIDLSSNFYFSYSYDLTRTLQHNMSAPRYVGSNVNIDEDEPLPDWNTLTNNVQSENERVDYAFRSNSRTRFIWNDFLLKPAKKHILLKDWLLEITHGYVSESNINIFGKSILVCLIARRSTRFAGTRFLKRGANFQGDVANEVETEQIVMDGHRICSFTQMRGSIPSHWSQDVSKMVPKPPISLDLADPYSETAAKHFERLLFHYGSPIIVLNLVKKRERRKHESILTKEVIKNIKYLNQFLPSKHRMKYIHFDMARKSRGDNVMESLAGISEDVVQQCGMFFKDRDEINFQTGIVRVNCVDCLDRTNTAQFAIGKCVLAHQLAKLGFIKNPPKLEFDSDCVTMLENLYEYHGDTLALQYGGSQLVHRIKTYRKTAAWASQGNDIMQTLSRYYRNTFNDTEKQHSINLFLGYYIPSRNDPKQNPIWELQTDYYMHNYKPFSINSKSSLLTDWVRRKVRLNLPYSCSDSNKIVNELFRAHSRDLEMIDSYANYHCSFRYTEFTDHIAFQISQLAMRFAPKFRVNFSPFQPGRDRRNENTKKNPSLSGQSSTSSNLSSSTTPSSSEDGDSSSDTDFEVSQSSKELSSSRNDQPKPITFENCLPSTEDVYGWSLKAPSKEDMDIYRRYVEIGKLSSPNYIPNKKEMIQKRMFGEKIEPLDEYKDSFESVAILDVDDASLKIYEDYVDSLNNLGAPSVKDLDIIMKYYEKIQKGAYEEFCE